MAWLFASKNLGAPCKDIFYRRKMGMKKPPYQLDAGADLILDA
jgi:hypothetical protein